MAHASIRPLLEKAEEKARACEWMTAAGIYERALEGIELESSVAETARITALLASSYFRTAFQSATREQFKKTMQLAEASYEKAGSLYEMAGSHAFSKREIARTLFATFWITDDPEERRDIIEKCVLTVEEATRVPESLEEGNGLAKAYNDMLTYLSEGMSLATVSKVLTEQFEKALLVVEKVIAEQEVLGDNEDHLESLLTGVDMLSSGDLIEPARYQELAKKAESLLQRAAEISARIGTPYARYLASTAASIAAWNQRNFDNLLDLGETSILAAEATRDSRTIGLSLVYASNNAFWVAVNDEDMEKKHRLVEKSLELALGAIKNLEVCLNGQLLAADYDKAAECYIALAVDVETDAEKKRAHLREAINIAGKGMMYKDYSPSYGHALSKATYFLATMQAEPREKAKLLYEAMRTREESARATDLLAPRSWNAGIHHNYIALIKAELSAMSPALKEKVELLQGAVSEMSQCLEVCSEALVKTPMYLPAFVKYQEWYGDIVSQLYRLTSDPDKASLAVKAYEDAIADLGKLEHVGGIPPIRWKLARVYETMGDCKAASQAFTAAAEAYRLGAKKVAGSEGVFGELASYMESWSLIEDARLHHSEEQLLLSAESYTKAAQMLQTIPSWSHLSKHYLACSYLEGGEALSRQERQEASMESISAAAKTFRENKAEIQKKLGRIGESKENDDLRKWLDITDGRLSYCLGRIELEEAKFLDRKGQEEASRAKYGRASEIFRALVTREESEQGRRELETLALFCDAWQKMKEAETRASQDLYREAADLFVKAEKSAARKRFRLLALADASICRALESGTRFRRTRDTRLYSEIKRHLETAADYYQEAGFESATAWSHATQRLFDALVYLADAETERDPKKKTELFHLTELHLELAAKLYSEAGFPLKSEEARRHLTRARQEKEILLTPFEALVENPVATGVAVSPVFMVREQALGLERFEEANVVGNLSVPRKEVEVGSELTMELEMANVGKTTATLIKLENLVPDGIEVDLAKIPQPLENNHIDMKGRRLEYLKTYKVKVPLRLPRKGSFLLKPKVFFADEKGAYRSYEFESSSVIAKEVAGRSPLESERRLSAIMFTDIAGYTSLTEEDEVLALALLEEHRKLLRPLFSKHNGREVKTVGDMFLLEFPSGLEAVTCAIEIQEALSERNRECSKAKMIHLRIGIHIGDVEHSHGDVYGDAVNVASRMEPLAEPGGIVVTRQVYEQIRYRPGIEVRSLGIRELKNVKEPLEVFTISS